jgi:hypothetical protein
MNKTILVALMCFAVMTSASKLNKRITIAHTEPTVAQQLEDIESSEFGKKILYTIALQIKNDSPLTDIARMLAEIRQDLILQEHEADNLHAQQEQECEDEVIEYNRRIDVAEVTRDDAQTEIVLLQGEVAVLKADVLSKSGQLNILDNREAALRSEREADAFAFQARIATNNEVLSAIDLILEKLSGITPSTSSAAVLAQLNKIGKSNPILALAHIASTFNAESFRTATSRLEALRDSLEETNANDTAEEERSVADFNTAIGELTATRREIAAAKAESEGALAQAEAALSLQESILDESVNELASAQTGRANKEATCADWSATWERNKEARNNELNLIGQVQNIIATKLDTASMLLQKREV